MTRSEAFFSPERDGFRATELCRGPWDPRFAHAGPPAALLGRAAARRGAREGQPHLARLTIDLLRPIPLGWLSTSVEVVRGGRSALWLDLALFADEVRVARASALCLRESADRSEAASEAVEPLPPPETAEPFALLGMRGGAPGYHQAVELRYVEGRLGAPSIGAWMRATVPLVEGESPSGVERALTVADAVSGVAAIHDHRRYTFVNADLTVAFTRPPEGEWIGLRARTLAGPRGVGLARADLVDRLGPFGVSAQNLLVEARRDEARE